MATVIDNPKTYAGKENAEQVLRPLFMGKTPQEMGFRVILDIKSKLTLNFIGRLLKILMPYVAGFQGGTNVSRYQKKLTLVEYKAEMSYDKHTYADMIYYEIVNVGGVAQNDITGTDVLNAELKVFGNAVVSDVIRNFWLGDTAKLHIYDGKYPDGSAFSAGDPDKYYNNANGILKSIFTDARQAYTSKHGAIAGWDKTTVPVLYIAGGATAYAYATAAKRTGAQAADRLFSFAGTNATYPVVKPLTELNSSGFSGSIRLLQATTSVDFEIIGNDYNLIPRLTLAAALGTDGAETAMKNMLNEATPELMQMVDEGKARFYVTREFLNNYKDTLESGTTADARTAIINGITVYKYRGIEIIVMPIDSHIENDHVSTYPRNIALLTVPENLCLGLNGSSDSAETRFWFNPDENENRQRTQFDMAMDYILPELIVAAYE
jgi:hypothetical protein